jgi:hypothetical protein
MLFFTDGHSSRINFRAMWLCKHFHVEILKLLAHCSHFQQPFDIVIASPEKAHSVMTLENLQLIWQNLILPSALRPQPLDMELWALF